MHVFAIAGGAGPGAEFFLSCCGCFPMMPLVLALAGFAIHRNVFWPAGLSLLLAGLPILVLASIVREYKPSTDWEEIAEQTMGRQALVLHTGLAAIAVLSVLIVAIRRVWRNEANDSEKNSN